MSWEHPDRRWEFPVGEDPSSDLPDAWATATAAVTCDLACLRHGRRISLTNLNWCLLTSGEWIAVGFGVTGATDVGAFQRCQSYRLHTTPAQATVWLADTVQEHLAGYEFVQWPIAEPRLLTATFTDDRALWVDTGSDTVAAPIGSLCTARLPRDRN